MARQGLCVAALSACAYAATISLNNFQSLGYLPSVDCIIAYNEPIPSCTFSDFASPGECSAECKDGLEDIQRDVRAACDSDQPPEDSLLYEILQGDLPGAVCDKKWGGGGGGSTAPVSHTSTEAWEWTSVFRTTTVTAAVPSSKTVNCPSLGTSVGGTTSKPSSTTAGSTQTRESHLASSSTHDERTQRTEATRTDTQSTGQTSMTSAEHGAQTKIPGSGGGSPADFISGSSAKHLAKSLWLALLLLGLYVCL